MQESAYYVLHGHDGWKVFSQDEYDPEKIYRVKPRGEDWVVEKEWSARPSNVFEKKKPAVERGKELAERNDSLLLVHKQDGAVHQRHDYRTAELAV